MFSDEDLMKVIKGEPIGSFFPFLGGTKFQIIDYLKELVNDINSSKIIKAETASFGCGYASFLDLFCYKKFGMSTRINKNSQYITGISIYLCKLAPVATWGGSEEIITGRSSCGPHCLEPQSIELLPEGDWDEFMFVLKDKLHKFNIEILKKRYLKQSLQFDANIPTLLNASKQYKNFDALFYWQD